MNAGASADSPKCPRTRAIAPFDVRPATILHPPLAAHALENVLAEHPPVSEAQVNRFGVFGTLGASGDAASPARECRFGAAGS